ncbi:MAG TPA: 16S rRNA (cytidine(1402)-2'-O)-methyltransferase [Casimicrobiaceae bacterium]|nr:16S rRNA (cytidine(1402)-2'-O)-methyltransferase [Casimicrobiaceae bacterium]
MDPQQGGDAGDAAFRAAPGSLYVVATPIGNLRDVTLRALDILRSVDIIAAEDTRVTAKLLSHYQITTRSRSLHAHNEASRRAAIIADLAAGRSVALVSDAGTPAISDPGAKLVRACADAGHRVVPIPGASAIAAAVSVSGLAAERFVFIGFLPTQAKARGELLAAFAAAPIALVLYEAPQRVAATVVFLAQALGDERTLIIAREISKTFESISRLALGDAARWIAEDSHRSRGEFVLIVEAPPHPTKGEALPADADRLLGLLLDELPPARAARVAAALTGAPRDALYARALALRGATL